MKPIDYKADEFQSTLPRGERLFVQPCIFHCFNFNPRSREGSDRMEDEQYNQSRISIHAPARGATHFSLSSLLAERFQSTLPRGERQSIASVSWAKFFISIHAPARGATDAAHSGLRIITHFNPRSREGSDVSKYRVHLTFKPISIHAPARGATFAAR